MLDGVGHTGVLCHALVGEVDGGVFTNGNVLEKSVALDGVVDIGFAFLVEVDYLCIAAAFKVEHAVVVPAVLVVTDKQTLGIGGKGGLACAGEAEEDSGVFAVEVGVGRAVHRCDALQGKEVVHHREHTFLHFTAVPCVDDNLLAGCEVEHNCGFAVEAEFLIVGKFSLGSVVNDEVGSEVGEFFGSGANEHVGHEVSLPCYFHDEANSHAGVLVGTAETVYNIEFFAGEFVKGESLASVPSFLRGFLVVVGIFGSSPPYGVFALFVENDEFVFRRAAGVYAGHHVYRTEFGSYAFFESFESRKGFLLEEFFVGGVVHHFGGTFDAVLSQIGFDFSYTGLFDFFNLAHFRLLEKIWIFIYVVSFWNKAAFLSQALFIGCKGNKIFGLYGALWKFFCINKI